MFNKDKEISLNKIIIISIISVIIVSYIINSIINGISKLVGYTSDRYNVLGKNITILSSYDYSSLEKDIVDYASKNNINVKFIYKGDLEIVDELNNNSKDYDAVWISNSMWLYMLDNNYLHSDSKSLGISPVVFGIRKSKAKELGLIDKDVTNKEIVDLISEKKIKYVMNSVTATNTGATAYLGFLTSLAGNPDVLTEEILNKPELADNLKKVFSGVERVSGDEAYLEDMFINNDNYEAVISSESSLININKKLKSNNKEELYLIYPTDGVAINDSTFAFIDNHQDKEEDFLKLQNYLLSKDGQKLLQNKGIRTWYGGVTDNPNKKIFNPDWGINTTKNLKVTRFPSKDMITKSINLYINTLRKPTHVVFCLDYSGSMWGEGRQELVDAMEYVLNKEKASVDNLQFSNSDKITVIPFSSDVIAIWNSTGENTQELRNNINKEEATGATALYTAIMKGISILDEETDEYTKTIIAMTDGYSNEYKSIEDLRRAYEKSTKKVPIYGITFGQATEYELLKVANLSNAKVFNGKDGLLRAFKEVRSYN